MGNRKQNRSLSFEMILWIVLVVVLPFVILGFYSYFKATSGLKDLEKEQAIVKSAAAQKMFNQLGESILGVTITNGLWENNRQALIHKDMEWLKTNIYSIPDLVPDINFVAEADNEGRVIIQHGEIAELTNTVQLPVIMEKYKDIKGFTGITNTSKGLAIVAVSPITDDSGKGEPAGMLITGRFIDDAILQRIKSTLQSDLAVLTQSGQFLSSTDTITHEQVSGFLNVLQAKGTAVTQFSTAKQQNLSIAKVAAAFPDMAGKPMAVLYLENPSKVSGQVGAGLKKQRLFAGVMIVVLLFIVQYLLRRRIIYPLRQFRITMEKIASGAQVDTIPNNVMQAEAQIVSAFQKIIEWNHMLEKTVAQRTFAIRNLLDNAGQGFMLIGSDLIVSEEHSAECNRIFNQEVAKLRFPELLYPNDTEECKLLQSILTEYFKEEDENSQELIFSLLPAEVYINGIAIELDYKVITGNDEQGGKAVMVVMTDISEKKLLENKMDAERHLLKMVVKVVTNFEDFAEMIRDYEFFCETEIDEIVLKDGLLEHRILEIFKRIHTLKGTCGLLYLINLVPNLHEMESQLAAYLKRKEQGTIADLLQFLAGFPMKVWLNEDIALLKDILGDEFLQHDQAHLITIDLQRLIEFEEKICLILTDEKDKPLLMELKKWRYRPIKSFFKSYPEFIQRMAELEGVHIHPLVIESSEMMVDPKWFQPFAKTLIHTLRNVIVHGIESSEERIDSGKEEFGTIKFLIQRDGEQIRITISDDGRGIDPDHIRVKLIEKGLLQQEAAQMLSNEAVLDFIFQEEFSTKDEVSELAGRGLGLSAVKNALEQIGGLVRVNTAKGRGTSFEFRIPFYGI
jgi:two-component system chemotaxis sensor kinase CheA